MALADWVRAGGGLMMAGGYLSFQGFQARANFARSPLADVLPVTMFDCDDRVESPQGAPVALVEPRAMAGGASSQPRYPWVHSCQSQGSAENRVPAR